MQQHKILLIFAIIMLGGCGSVPPVDFTIQDVGVVNNRKDAELKSLTVGFASEGQQKNMYGNILMPPSWKMALQDALNRSLIFKDNQDTKVNISVRIVEYDKITNWSADKITKVAAIYEVIDRSNGALLFSEMIESSATITLDQGPRSGAIRGNKSQSRAVRKNIANFINRLQQSDFSRPLFKGKK